MCGGKEREREFDREIFDDRQQRYESSSRTVNFRHFDFFLSIFGCCHDSMISWNKKKRRKRGINFTNVRSSSRVEHRMETRQKSRINIGQYVLGINYH